MSKRYRLSLMVLSIIALLLIGRITNGNFDFIVDSFWFASGLLLLILLSLIDQPFFSKDSNIFVNGVTAGLSLLLVRPEERTVFFWLFWGFAVYLIVSSYILMWIRTKPLSEENKCIQFFSRFNRIVGKPEAIFSAFFLWGVIRQYSLDSTQFNALLGFWIVFMILDIPSIATVIDSCFSTMKKTESINAIGSILGVQSKSTFLVKLRDDRTESISRLELVEFLYSADKKEHRGIILDIYQLNQEQWIKVLTTPEIDTLCGKTIEKYVPDMIYKSEGISDDEFTKHFVGIVSENSRIEKIRFAYNSSIEICNGQLVELQIGKHKVLYQITEAITQTERLEDKNESAYIIGEAIQLGEWNEENGRFELFGWVPTVNTPIFIASNIEEPPVQNNEYIIGHIPGTNYPVIINKEYAITHHTAILGITGSGKSVFTRNLINQIIDDNTKVIIVDLTGEYKAKDPLLESIVDPDSAKTISENIEYLATEMAKFPDKRDKAGIAQAEYNIKLAFKTAIEKYLSGNASKAVFELSDITNNASVLDYTRWFFWVLFNVAKHFRSFGKRVCVALEEAHTIIPEVTTMGVSDNASKATVNSISQIALQGRKYNIGFFVIAQRTANVSKTVLTQCNSIISFQELDKTSCDFLSNYMGQNYINSLSSLKPRMAIAVGKAFRSNVPMIFEVPEINE